MNGMDDEALLEQNELFIRRTASAVLSRRITRSDDEYSVALSAFFEAARSHDPSKGSLQSYAAVVIRHRLIDDLRSKKNRREILADPAVFGGETTEESAALQAQVEQSLAQSAPETVLREEIEALEDTIRKYGISFFDLPKCSPKARKTRHTCLKAARFVTRLQTLLVRLRRTLKLPASEMETGVPIARKLLDQFRKYIITAIEIEAGDFPALREYLAGKGEEA